MSSARRVPETRLMAVGELSPDAVWRALRRHGRWPLARDAYRRLRYADGFSHARGVALQLCLAVVPFLIALTGLAVDLGADRGGGVIADTVLSLTPGASVEMVDDVLPQDSGGEASPSQDRAGELALLLGLVTGMGALTLAMAQVERGANRIYGVERDRPALWKYLRAAGLAVVAGLPALFGFLLLAAGASLGDSIQRRFAWGHWADTFFSVARWPVSLVLTVLAVAVLFRHAPRRRQPSLPWLVPGAAIATVLWWLATVLLAAYVRFSDAFGAVYGPLTAVMALLVWANLTGVTLLAGLAFTAQLEASRVGAPKPVHHDHWEPAEDEPATVPRPRETPAEETTA